MKKLKIVSFIILLILVLFAYVPKVITIQFVGKEDPILKFAREHKEFIKPIQKIYEDSHTKADTDILQALGGN